MPISLSNIRAALLPGLHKVTKRPSLRDTLGATIDLLSPALYELSRQLDAVLVLEKDQHHDFINLKIYGNGREERVVYGFLSRHDIDHRGYIHGFAQKVRDAVDTLPESTIMHDHTSFTLSEIEQAQALIDELKCKAS